jgi:hypothetical protein
LLAIAAGLSVFLISFGFLSVFIRVIRGQSSLRFSVVCSAVLLAGVVAEIEVELVVLELALQRHRPQMA